jgi:hypothetical protein
VITLRDQNDGVSSTGTRWTFGSSIISRFGGAYPDGEVNLSEWCDDVLTRRVIKCRSYRRAVRVLRWHIMGYKV